MSYGQIGFTRRDKTPQHWRKDYNLKTKAKKLLAQIASDREGLYKELKSLSDDLTDDEYDAAAREISAKLDALIDRADDIRRANPA
jgi:hypothetical protein